jgi:hypothetical protein
MTTRASDVVNNIIAASDLAIFDFTKNQVSFPEQNVDLLAAEDLPEYAAKSFDADTTLVRIIDKMMNRSVNTPEEVGWAVRVLHFLFLYLDPSRKIDGYVNILINAMKDLPVFIDPARQLAFGSLFWGVETARQMKVGTSSAKLIGNDEETILSIVGLHYSLVKAIADMRADEPRREWVRSALLDIFMGNTRLKKQLDLLYVDMQKTSITRGNSTFTLLGIFLASYDDSTTPQYNNTLVAYDACTRNMYVPWCRLK